MSARDRLLERMTGDPSVATHVDMIRENGRTTDSYAKSQGFFLMGDGVIYVLARTPDGQLYESYARTGQDEFYPGFDTVESGRMKMGPVPARVRSEVESAFRAALNSAPTNGPAESGAFSFRWLVGAFVLGVIGAIIVGKRRSLWGRSTGSPSGTKSREEPLQTGMDNGVNKDLEEDLASDILDLKEQVKEKDRDLQARTSEAEALRTTVKKSERRVQKMKAELAGARSKIDQLQHAATDSPEEDLLEEDSPTERSPKESQTPAAEGASSPDAPAFAGTSETDGVDNSTSEAKASGAKGSDAKGSDARASGARAASAADDDKTARENEEPATEDPSRRAAIGETFVEWCREGGSMVDRYYMFARRLQGTVDDVTVKPVYARSQNGDVFGAECNGHEYWLVTSGGTSYLLPVPGSGSFTASSPAFQSPRNVKVETLAGAQPAHVVPDGKQYRLESSGHLASEADETVADKGMPDETMPDETMPDETMPDETMPDEVGPSN